MQHLMQSLGVCASKRIAIVLSKLSSATTKDDCEYLINALRPDITEEFAVTNVAEFHFAQNVVQQKIMGAVKYIRRTPESSKTKIIGDWNLTLMSYLEEHVDIPTTQSPQSPQPTPESVVLRKSQQYQLTSGCKFEFTMTKEGKTIELASTAQWKYSSKFLIEAITNLRVLWNRLAAIIYQKSSLTCLKFYAKELEKLDELWTRTRFSEMEARFGRLCDGKFVSGLERSDFQIIRKKLDSWKKWQSVTEFLKFKEDYVAIHQHKNILTYRRQEDKTYQISALDRLDIIPKDGSIMRCRIAVKQEKLIQDAQLLKKLDQQPISHSREKWRKRYVHNSGFYYELTMVEPDVYEFEIERMDGSSTESFLAKIADFVPPNWEFH